MTNYSDDIRQYYGDSDVPENALQRYISSLEQRIDGAPGVCAMVTSRERLLMARGMAKDLTRYPKALDLLATEEHVELALEFYQDYLRLERLSAEEMVRNLSDDQIFKSDKELEGYGTERKPEPEYFDKYIPNNISKEIFLNRDDSPNKKYIIDEKPESSLPLTRGRLNRGLPFSATNTIIAGIVASLSLTGFAEHGDLPPYLKKVEAWYKLRSNDDSEPGCTL